MNKKIKAQVIADKYLKKKIKKKLGPRKLL